MKNIAKAIVAVMQAVKGVEKNSKVGSGSYGYEGVSDKDVKLTFNPALAANGLSVIPLKITPVIKVDRWQEGTRQKQSVFTEVTVEYLLLHTSGESITGCGYGHGVDAQDKGAGKATTYALKNFLLYTFLTPTGEIEDTDKTPSDEIDTPPPVLPKLDESRFKGLLASIKAGTYTKEKALAGFNLTDEQKAQL